MASGIQDIHQSKLAVEARIKTLINNDLKEICRGENLAVSGVKAQLQTRILQRMCRVPRSRRAFFQARADKHLPSPQPH